MRSKNQKLTLDTYEKGLSQYIEKTPSIVTGEYKNFLDSLTNYISTKDKIFEIGSGLGRDAKYLISLGYSVQTSDIASSFLEHLRNNSFSPIYFDALSTDVGVEYDAILALAVFLHFSDKEFRLALNNVRTHLKLGGYFAIRMKRGEGEELTDARMGAVRYFKYWQPKELKDMLIQHGFKIISETNTSDGAWLQYITQKY